MAGIAISSVLMSMSCTSAPQLVNVVRYAYEEVNEGVHIYLGAQTKGRMPHYQQYEWVQWVTTNAIRAQSKGLAQPGVPFIDPQPHDDNTDYYYTKNELPEHENQTGFDLTFEDRPTRDPKQYKDVSGTIYWHADLFLVGIESAANYSDYFPITHITYGFKVDQNGNTTWDDYTVARLPY